MNAPNPETLDTVLAESNKRFEIFVPKPKARINLGYPSKSKDDHGPFGYYGVSIQSGFNIFIDGNKDTLFQTGLSFNGQVGGTWTQYSNADMHMSATANVTVSGDNQVLMVAGAAQGQITALDHGDVMRLVPYNALPLHYVVDTIQTGLFEFFYGRHQRRSRKSGEFFFSQRNRLVIPWEASASEPYNKAQSKASGGFLKMAARSLSQLDDPAVDLTTVTIDEYVAPLEMAEIVPNLPDGDAALAKLEYGFSSYYKRFDPYYYGKPEGILKRLKKLMAKLRRFADVAGKYGEAVQNTFLVAQAIKLGEAVGSAFKFAAKMHYAATDSFPALVTFERATDTKSTDRWGGGGFGKGGVVDELKSGVLDRVTAGAEDKKAPKASKTKKKKKKASIESKNAGTWDLASKPVWTLTVAWDGGSKDIDITTGGAEPRPAEMTLRTPRLQAGREAKRLTLRIGSDDVSIDLTPENTGALPDFEAAVRSAFAMRPEVRVEVQGSTVTIAAAPFVSLDGAPGTPTLDWLLPTLSGPRAFQLRVNGATRIIALDPTSTANVDAFHAAVVSQAVDLGATVAVNEDRTGIVITPLAVSLLLPTGAAHNAELAPRLGVAPELLDVAQQRFALTPPRLSISGEHDVLSLAINGTTYRIPLDPTNTADSLAFAAALDRSVQPLATVRASSADDVLLRTVGTGASFSIQLQSATYRGRMNARPKARVRGFSPTNVTNPLTVDALLKILKDANLEGVKSSKTEEGKLKLEAEKEGVGSLVITSGNLAKEVFGSDPKEKRIDADVEEEVTFATADHIEDWVKTIQVWNHELQKLPEDVRNLTRPLTNALADIVDAAGAIEKALKKGAEIAKRGLPPPPKAVGILAEDGISMGTPDRIVANGGRGIVFIADGGTGTEDWGKFLFTENWVKEWLNLNEKLAKFLFRAPAPADPKPSLGFRVMSDSAVELTGTSTAQLLALGRANVTKARPDGQTDAVGIGIARVVGSYAAEVTGYEKVVISARSKGDPGDATKGGRVELAGRCIAIGAVEGEADVTNGLKLRLADFKQFGVDRMQLKQNELTGTELADATAWSLLHEEYQRAGWSDVLRQNHPRTEKIEMHGDEIVARALPFTIRMSSKGIVMGIEIDPAAEVQRLQDEVTRINAETQRLTARQATLNSDLVIATKMVAVVNDAHWQNRLLLTNQALAQVANDLLQAANDLASVNGRIAYWQGQAAALPSDPTYALPRLEMTKDHIRLGFTNGVGEWLIDPQAQNAPGGPGITAAAAGKGWAFLDITKSSYAVAQNPVLALKNGVATFSNGDGVLKLDKNKATMTFKQGIVADDGSIQLQVKGGTIHLG
jgi:hypothetical protein